MNENRDLHPKETIRIDRRSRIEATGVKDIKDFDDSSITLLTDDGYLIIEGRDLHIVDLSQESQKVTAEGQISGLYYQPVIQKPGLFRKKA